MNWGNLNLGNLSSALSMSGADPAFIERLRQEEEARQLAAAQGGQALPMSSPQGAPADRALPPKAAAALASYQANNHPENATGRDNGINVQSKRHSEISNEETVPYDQRVAELGGGDLGVQDGRLTLARDARQPTPLPEGTDQALARVKQNQSFQLPEGTDEALAKLGAPPRAQLANRPPINEGDGVGRLQQLSAENAREMVDVERQRGDLGAELGETKRALYQQDAVDGQIRTDETMQRRQEALERKDANTKTAYTALHAMQADLGSPPDTSKGRVLQIIGMVLSANKRTEGIGKGLAMLGGMMGDDVQKWSQGIEANEKIWKSFQEMNRHEDSSIESELRQEHQISTMVAANTLNSIKAAEEEAGSADAKLVARQLGNKVEEQWLNHQTDLKLRMDAAAREQGNKAELEEYMRMPPEALSAIVAAGQFPDGTPINATAANEALAKRTKLSQDIRGGEADIALKQENVRKMQTEATQGPKLSVDERRLDTLVKGALPAYDRLKTLIGDGGTVNRGATKETWVPDVLTSEDSLQQRADTDNILNAVLRFESGGQISDQELENKMNQHPVRSGDPQVRAQGYKDLLGAFSAMDTQQRTASPEDVMKPGQGLAPAGAPPRAPAGGGGAGGSATPRAGGKVHMVNPDTGEEVEVVPGKVSAAESLGFVVGRPSERGPKKPPRDDSALAEAPRASRDAGVGAGY